VLQHALISGSLSQRNVAQSPESSICTSGSDHRPRLCSP
jgi:hypothetical protein